MDHLQALARQVWSDPAYDHDMKALVDLRHATVLMQPTEVRELTGWIVDQPQSLRGRMALVATKPVETALCLMIQNALREHREVAVFSSLAGAETYLGLPPVDGAERPVAMRA
jgi:hypothetical protein